MTDSPTDDFKSIFEHMISGKMPDDEICQYLKTWKKNGISPSQLLSATKILRALMTPIKAPENAMDIVGTGGDGLQTYNISTAASFVVAGAGVPVAKHGNRAVSSKSGSSDVLSALGVKLDISIAQTEACLQDANICFMFAPNHHKAMGNVAAARKQFGQRSIFNMLGPLCNPASVKHYLLGVYDDELRDIYGQALLGLGAKKALIVRGCDGMDEVTTTRATMITKLHKGYIKTLKITPERFGFIRPTLNELEGGNAAHNAKALLGVLQGEQNPYTDIVTLNAGAAIEASGITDEIDEGMDLARQSIGSGAAMGALNKLIKASNV